MSEELKPCPFCESEDLKIFDDTVICQKCDAENKITMWNNRFSEQELLMGNIEMSKNIEDLRGQLEEAKFSNATMEELLNLTPSVACAEYNVQNCHLCDDLNCGDNTSKAKKQLAAAKAENERHVALIKDLYECAKKGQWLLFCTESCGREEGESCEGLFMKIHDYVQALAAQEASQQWEEW